MRYFYYRIHVIPIHLPPPGAQSEYPRWWSISKATSNKRLSMDSEMPGRSCL
ncbi:MAG: hypothetical protein ACLR7Z_14615 [Bilophila wadsworthia]